MSATTGLQLRSLITKSGELQLSLVEMPIPEPAADQVVVKVEATPINPSDLGLLLGPADMSTGRASGSGAAGACAWSSAVTVAALTCSSPA